jgi:hypothetical protein
MQIHSDPDPHPEWNWIRQANGIQFISSSSKKSFLSEKISNIKSDLRMGYMNKIKADRCGSI